jgi:tRNA U34 2-thiouridine synthase MnmA/TrmU
LFPLANLTKSTEVRELAKKFRLPTAEREESMGVCFIGEKRGKFGEFVGRSLFNLQCIAVSSRADLTYLV